MQTGTAASSPNPFRSGVDLSPSNLGSSAWNPMPTSHSMPFPVSWNSPNDLTVIIENLPRFPQLKMCSAGGAEQVEQPVPVIEERVTTLVPSIRRALNRQWVTSPMMACAL